MDARVLSVNVGQPRTISHEGRSVRTGIWKTPVTAPVLLSRLGFDGDGQADRRVHGGPTRAAYAYPHEHYAHWAERLGGGPLPMGQFGENLTTFGLLETTVHVRDVYAVGAARVRIEAPRGPCFKLGIRTGDPTIVAPFLASGRLGFYLSVFEEGLVGAGDPIALLDRTEGAVTFAEPIAAMHHPGVTFAERMRVFESPGITHSMAARIEAVLRDSRA